MFSPFPWGESKARSRLERNFGDILSESTREAWISATSWQAGGAFYLLGGLALFGLLVHRDVLDMDSMVVKVGYFTYGSLCLAALFWSFWLQHQFNVVASRELGLTRTEPLFKALVHPRRRLDRLVESCRRVEQRKAQRAEIKELRRREQERKARGEAR